MLGMAMVPAPLPAGVVVVEPPVLPVVEVELLPLPPVVVVPVEPDWPGMMVLTLADMDWYLLRVLPEAVLSRTVSSLPLFTIPRRLVGEGGGGLTSR